MIGTLISIIINGGAFFAISKFLPGFKVKDERTALIVSVIYSVCGLIAGMLVAPLVAIVVIFLALFAIIPVIGPLIAGAGITATVFLVFFTLSVILLIAIDKLMEDFKMESFGTAVIASLLLAFLNVGVRLLLPGI